MVIESMSRTMINDIYSFVIDSETLLYSKNYQGNIHIDKKAPFLIIKIINCEISLNFVW